MSERKPKRDHFQAYAAIINTKKVVHCLKTVHSDNLKLTCKTFHDNLESLSNAVMLPFSIAVGAVEQTNWIERFRRAAIELNLDEKNDVPREVIEERMKELDRGDNLEWSFDIVEDLFKNNEEVNEGIRNLLKIAVVNLWTIIEVLSSDVWLVVVNFSPLDLGRAVYHARKDRVSKILLDRLCAFGFDVTLSNEIGTISHPFFDFTGLKGIKDAFDTAFGKSAFEITNRLVTEPRLRKLQAMRNLIVHKGGIVDEAYRNMTGEALEVGTKLLIRGDDFTKLAKSVIQTGCELILFVDDHLSCSKNQLHPVEPDN